MGGGVGGHLLRGAGGHHLPAAPAALGTQVDDPVRVGDDIEVVLDDDHRVALVDQALEDRQELADVLEVQARRRLVQDVDRPARRAALELGGQLDALRLPARLKPPFGVV